MFGVGVEALEQKKKANIWTDNIFTTKQWLKEKNPSASETDINNMFEIPEDLDNIP